MANRLARLTLLSKFFHRFQEDANKTLKKGQFFILNIYNDPALVDTIYLSMKMTTSTVSYIVRKHAFAGGAQV
jgi:hypothetical protein